jgi:hypothetical protein
MAPSRDIAELVAIHHELDRVFAAFRELVLMGDERRAAAMLQAYRNLTARHADDEDRLLVPHLRDGARWPAELYTGQHEKLFAGIDRLATFVAAIRGGTAGWRGRALEALDAASRVHHLVEHHHLAEEQDLFPNAATDEAIVAMASAWHSARSTYDNLLAEAARVLADVRPAPQG